MAHSWDSAEQRTSTFRVQRDGRSRIPERGGRDVGVGLYKDLQLDLGVPVIDAILAPLAFAEFLIALRRKHGWTTSKVCGFASPPDGGLIDRKLIGGDGNGAAD